MRFTIEETVEKYKDRLFAVALNVTKNIDDADDAVQEAFISYYKSSMDFESENHIKAWLIRVTVNKAKDISSSFWKRHRLSLEEYKESLVFIQPEDSNLFDAVMALPEKYRVAIHLFYYEEYSVKEISEILNEKESTVKSHLSRGRMFLKEMLKEEWNND